MINFTSRNMLQAEIFGKKGSGRNEDKVELDRGIRNSTIRNSHNRCPHSFCFSVLRRFIYLFSRKIAFSRLFCFPVVRAIAAMISIWIYRR